MIEVVTSHELMTWRSRAITATQKAILAAEEYDRLKPRIMKHIQDHPGHYGSTDFSMRKALENNWTLADHARVHAFQRDLATMLWTAIASEHVFSVMTE